MLAATHAGKRTLRGEKAKAGAVCAPKVPTERRATPLRRLGRGGNSLWQTAHERGRDRLTMVCQQHHLMAPHESRPRPFLPNGSPHRRRSPHWVPLNQLQRPLWLRTVKAARVSSTAAPLAWLCPHRHTMATRPHAWPRIARSLQIPSARAYCPHGLGRALQRPPVVASHPVCGPPAELERRARLRLAKCHQRTRCRPPATASRLRRSLACAATRVPGTRVTTCSRSRPAIRSALW